MPYFSTEDANEYTLKVTIGDDTLKFPIVGCKGQKIEVNIPKKYKGKKANFAITVNDNEYSINGTIKKGLEIEFEKIIILEGEDD